MVRWSLIFVSMFALLGTGCGGNESPESRPKTQATTSLSMDSSPPDTAKMDTSTVPADEGAGSASSDPDDQPTAPAEGETDASDRTLTDAQKNRIGGRLQRLIRREEGGSRPVEPVGSRGGASVYEVLIKCDDPDALREAGIPLGSVQGNVITARLTIDQIRTAATVDAVGGIQAAIQQETHEKSREGDMEVQPMDQEDGS